MNSLTDTLKSAETSATICRRHLLKALEAATKSQTTSTFNSNPILMEGQTEPDIGQSQEHFEAERHAKVQRKIASAITSIQDVINLLDQLGLDHVRFDARKDVSLSMEEA